MDLHLLESGINPETGLGFQRIAYHIQNIDKGVNNNYPGNGGTSVVLNIGAELTGLTNGTFYEAVVSIGIDINDEQSVIETLAQEYWHVVASTVREELNRNYKFYGIELTRS